MQLFWRVPVIVFRAQDLHVLHPLVQRFHNSPEQVSGLSLKLDTQNTRDRPRVITHTVTVRNHWTVAAEHLLCGGNLHGGASHILYIISASLKPLFAEE